MKQRVTQGIVLQRTDFGEADRIVTVLTPHDGKLSLMAKGVRRPKSKLAGGIELFSVSDITYLAGKGSVGTLISARLTHYYSDIVRDITRVQLGYELIKRLHRATEDHTEAAYFSLLTQTFEALNTASIDTVLIHTWFEAQLLRIAGHEPQLRYDVHGQPLSADQTYRFVPADMSMEQDAQGMYNKQIIQVLRLLFGEYTPVTLAQVNGVHAHVPIAQAFVRLVGAEVQ